MNWAALRHLCWVLLLLDVVSGGEEDQSSRPTTPVRLRRPIRRNSIKKSSEDDFKPSIFPDDPSSTTGSTRFTTKRTSAVDYLARNTVPVASVTETSRKPYRPPPAHLLTYQALSSTEKGSGQTNEPNLSPTGWAVASLGPPKNSSLVTKKSNTPLGTTRPLTSYWSTRLRRPPSLRTSPIPPIGNEGQRSSEEGGGAAVAIPSDNLIKYDSNATASHPKLHNDFPGAAKDTTLGPASSQKDNVLEKPLNAKKPDITTPSQIFQVTTDNTRNNLIKELRGGDIGSKILHGIVAVTNASQYSDEVVDQHKDDGNGGSSTQKVESIDSHTPQDDTNVVDESIKLVTRKSEHGAMSSVTNDPLMHNTTDVSTEGSLKEHASTHFNISEAPPATTRAPLETRPITIARFSKESLQITTESSKETFPTAAATFPTMTSRSDSQESSQESGTFAVSSEDYELSSELPTDRQTLPDRSVSFTKSADSKEMELNETTPSQPITGFPVPKSSISMSDVSTPVSIITETDTTITTSIPESSILPVIANMTSQLDRSSNENASVPHFFTTAASAHENVTATTVSQEVNDIPEAYTRVKNNPEKSASEGSSEVSFPTSTTTIAKSTPRQETRRPSTYKTTTTFSTTESSGSTKTTTEIPVASIPTSTQSIQETTTVVVKDTRPELETEAATTWEVIPATDKSKEEVTSRSSIDVPTTTPMIQFKTTVSSHVPTKPIMESAETTTAHYGQGVSHGVSTTEYVHVGLSEKPEDDHDDTLKYNVTTIDHPHNGTETDESEEEPDDETERDGDVHTTTTLVIIEEITTPKSTTGSTNIPTQSSTEQPSSTSTRSKTDDDELSATADKTSESSEPRLRLTFEASFKEMCLVRDSLAETIASYFKSVSSRSIQPNQVKILNLGMAECSSKSLPLMEKVPVFVQITNAEGKGDHNLTDILYSYIKQNPFNFKYQLAHVEHGQKPLVMEEDNQWGGTVIAAIVISSVAGVSLLCLTILLVIMRKRQKGFTYGQRCTPVSLEDYSLDNISVFNSVRRKAMRASKRSYGNPAFDDPVTVTNPLNFVGLSNMANSHQKIDNEYSEVPTVTVKPDELPPGAEHKNRYANVIPIPETRVPLKGPDGEDMFINANYVKGVKGAAKFYIACQAPLESTIADFWTMVWEQQSQVILMLTDLHENGVEKSADYLPPSEVLDCHRVFGDLQVTLKKREVREKYIISSLQLRNLESNLWREVIHLWYTGWPIRGVPEDLPSIIAYLIEARSYSKPGHPIVVHCSPGTGRTGTVIAIDIAIRDFETDRTVDIPKTVYGIRRDRAGAVQTNLQYYMIYQVIHLYATKLTGGSLDSI